MARNKTSKKIPSGYGSQTKESKTPRILKPFDTGYNENPVWQIGNIDLDGPFGWSKIDRGHLLYEILPKIRDFESMKWQEILGRNNHEIRISDISRTAQRRLEDIKLDDIDQLVSLRLTARERIWGIKSQRTLRVLWWDPEHQVCPSLKKHT